MKNNDNSDSGNAVNKVNKNGLQGQVKSWFEVLPVILWGSLLLKYSAKGELALLIHPNYFWLVTLTGFCLLIIAAWKILLIVKKVRFPSESMEHTTLFPPLFSTTLMTIVAFVGLVMSPQVLTAQTALQRGLTESLPLTTLQAESFVSKTNPADRSLIDWVRTINAYPEPDFYTDQEVKVNGFVVHVDGLPEDYVLLSRFVITCCAVDAYPIGLPLKLDQSRDAYPPDTWLEITGKMATEEFTAPAGTNNFVGNSGDNRQLVILPTELKKISTPANPYDFR